MLARPVRSPPKSRRKSSTAFSMRVRAWAMASLLVAIVVMGYATLPFQCTWRLLLTHQRSDFFSEHHALDIARHIQIEDQNRHAVVHAQRDGRRIHDREPALQHIQIGDALDAAGGAGVFLGGVA